MVQEEALISELQFSAMRSSGAGGQNVNKVSSKVELRFDVEASLALNEEQKQSLFEKLQNKISNEGVLILQCDESRSQHKNKQLVIERFLAMIQQAFKKPKKRKPTKIPASVKRKRLDNKRKQSDKKANRKPPEI
ncbi:MULTISPECIES: alternative ribosome rescue aminoacyl-tRNA hydrolase ArfB [Mangrovimonas]|uniref:alternative ribosome rescue aminoacyl-tRNA hydrolase ArfB n=1 Tax=Mangrovimonas TaxID=1211036 RepID=UPI0006B580DE|nr:MULTISPECIES: alternative ribosome rescue aminoacyl-tRNA hydrolase ArfB [Mangrovimonas]MCF1420582.1 aminoacyl-tRNA hydrolase [Mangrovimonas futianensis]NIK91670.1 aminoacyl-tRNA hydrolase [Mangrovimonas sp. CR14]